MRVERIVIAGEPVAAAAGLRALVPGPESVRDAVEQIVDEVRTGGDAALHGLIARLDSYDGPVAVSPAELDAALAALDPAVRKGLEVAVENVRAVADAALAAPVEVTLPQGHTVSAREVPVRRAGIYVPGGRAPYPSTAVMGVVTARAAGVEEIVVCAPGSRPVILAACRLAGADEVLRMGGAHAIAALTYGTETIERVDVIAGPGNLYVQEAKRLVSGAVGIDGFAGPSDVLVLAAADADPGAVAADLLAQAEHGPGTIVAVVSADAALREAVSDALDDADTGAVAGVVEARDRDEALAFAEAFAPEHLQLMGAEAEELAAEVRSAGCVFVGAAGSTAFGDYVAGSNHILPTGGAARFSSALSPRHFRRRLTEVRIGPAADALARAGAPLAEAEGFTLHAAAMRLRENPTP